MSSNHQSRKSFAGVARSVAGWTSNLLATGVVLVAVLAFGRQLVSWWSTSPEKAFEGGPLANAELGVPELGDRLETHSLDFGDLPLAFSRTTMIGDDAAVFASLREQCRTAMLGRVVGRREPGPREARLLTRIADQEPVERKAGRWKMYQLDGPLPMVAVVQDEAAAGIPWSGDTPSSRDREPATARGRVLCWGLALPAGAATAEWTLFTFVPTGEPGGSRSHLPELPRPPGGQRVMSLRTEEGGALVVLDGDGDPRRWLDDCQNWFRQQGWSVATGWQTLGDRWYGRFVSANREMMVQVTVAQRGRLSAIMTVIPQSSEARPGD